jgi:excisionase family DNA binding protein
MPRLAVDNPDLATLAEAAVELGISYQTAKQLAAAGRFPGDAAVRVGGQWRVSRIRLNRYLHGEGDPQ